ncbi:3'(2'),5'-bisphosphate nucleotidase CysQ [Vineibacter terrae]|uniref:inositol monophosphatase family protein n=1 Tax=Vineibacter terrae TaxID=2586908 RepID=UPI002E30343A|nr:3'(2'),5'-bisphosphate nucleotidase CysQ [Vineibacter terrae]HEX2886636.1 3'(2'),5'-bisphosphate nucleotidase CysQ [Vineibacter terrae]
MTDFADDVALMVAAVREAGALALRFYRTELAVWQKAGGTPVSEADITVDRHLRQRLCTARPGYGWLSEETEDDTARLTRGRVWVVDPIDGTRAFVEGTPHFCHAVALVEDGVPVAAALFNPATDEFFEAVAHQGARLNGTPIRVSGRQQIAGCRMAAYGPMFKHPAWQDPWPDMEIIQRDSVAYRLALVASGAADAAMGLNTKNDWDLAAADLIVREAGGKVTAHDGKPLAYNNEAPQQPSFLAAGPDLHAALLARTGRIKLRSRRAES